MAVVIPSWNGLDKVGAENLSLCLVSALNQTDVSTTVVLVDNGSQDRTVEWVKASHPEVVVIELQENLGFAGGVNSGIRWAMAEGFERIALLNNDAVASLDWLETLWPLLELPGVGMATGKILRDDGRIDSTGDSLTTWGLPLPRGRDETDRGQYDGTSSRDVFSASGGAVLMQARMLAEIGLLDERFFAYYEDVDLAFRARLRGWKVMYEPGAIVRHEVNRTSSTMPGFVEFHSLKNLAFLWAKNVPGSVGLRYLHRFATMFAFRVVYTARSAGVRVTLRSLGRAVVEMPGILADRGSIQRTRTASNASIVDAFDHEWRPRSFGGPRSSLLEPQTF